MDGFAQHSLIFHETLVSSQIAAGTDDHTVSSSSFMNTSFASMSSKIESQSHGDSQAPILQVPSTLTMTALSSLPSADALRAIYPQTPTHNLLCVLTTQPEDREILVKKGKYRMHLREVTVADDTRSDFKVSFWSRPSQKDDAQNVLFNTLSRLKVGDILLLRNIALNAFRDNVYGQSLNLSITRARTTVEVLMSDGSISSHQLDALPATIVGPFMKVKKWAKTHVAPDIRALRKRKQPDSSEISAAQSRARHEAHDSSLPPDTMEGI
ncbi:hypothetical protein P280DRAFT_396093 [Massarina eburnea CBS 473.64]|uniref:Nucleic acid-binding protein n=1 Tax=Massarina eburnea CBS 473.64 TaxID=1395130 RepID=A0A6A6S4W7_9PLEO|nr:hypothetical protein P280DRAFT_396093 [Massarina eburnea CBS 473.64]